MPLVSYFAAMLLVLITYSTLSLHYLFAMVSDERSNMFAAADEKKLNEMGSTVNGATSKRDEYIAFSIIIIVNFEIMPNYSLVSHSPLLSIFQDFMCYASNTGSCMLHILR